MELCVSMWSMHRRFYDGNGTVLDFLQFCHEHGIRQVELLDNFWRNEAEELPQVQAYLTSHGMSVGAYAVSNDFVHTEAEKRHQAVTAVLAGIPMAHALNTRVVRVFAGDLKPGYDFDSSAAYIVAGLKEAALEAEQAGIVLALENHGKLAGKAEQVKGIIDQVGSPALKSTFDCGNFLLVAESPLDALATLRDQIGHVHVKDMQTSEDGSGWPSFDGLHYKGAACGQGLVPFAQLMAALQALPYEGSISLEFEGSGDEAAGVLDSIAYLKQWVGNEA